MFAGILLGLGITALVIVAFIIAVIGLIGWGIYSLFN